MQTCSPHRLWRQTHPQGQWQNYSSTDSRIAKKHNDCTSPKYFSLIRSEWWQIDNFSSTAAETSISIPNIAAVIDSGVHNVSLYDPYNRAYLLETIPITVLQAKQRAGRSQEIFRPLHANLLH
jgi:hypothetical protein